MSGISTTTDCRSSLFAYPGSKNGSVLRESIADSHRTREMWQQISTNHMTTDGQSKTSVTRREQSSTRAAPTGDVRTTCSAPNSTSNSLQRKASSANGHSPTHINWRPKSGPSSQMERQIKEYRSSTTPTATAKRSGSLVQSAIHTFERDPPVGGGMENGRSSAEQIMPIDGTTTTSSDRFESERLLFIKYVKSHPEVVKSLGISVPTGMIDSRLPADDVKVELTVIESDKKSQLSSTMNRHHATKTMDSSMYGSRTDMVRDVAEFQRNASEFNADTLPRYKKQVTGSQRQARTHGDQPLLIRRQSQPDSIQSRDTDSSGSRRWKSAKLEYPDKQNGAESDHAGYRSAGESLIAREICEYKNREEELRRSRSELGLANIDLIKREDTATKEIVGHGSPEATKLENDHPNNSERKKSRTTADYNAYNATKPVPKAPLVIGGGGHRVAAYPPDLKKAPLESGGGGDSLLCRFGDLDEGDFMPVEARIEREMEDLRRREVELKRQRDALGLRYYGVGLAQFSPYAPPPPEYGSSSDRRGSSTNDIRSSNGHDCNSPRKNGLHYPTLRKHAIADNINNILISKNSESAASQVAKRRMTAPTCAYDENDVGANGRDDHVAGSGCQQRMQNSPCLLPPSNVANRSVDSFVQNCKTTVQGTDKSNIDNVIVKTRNFPMEKAEPVAAAQEQRSAAVPASKTNGHCAYSSVITRANRTDADARNPSVTNGQQTIECSRNDDQIIISEEYDRKTVSASVTNNNGSVYDGRMDDILVSL